MRLEKARNEMRNVYVSYVKNFSNQDSTCESQDKLKWKMENMSNRNQSNLIIAQYNIFKCTYYTSMCIR